LGAEFQCEGESRKVTIMENNKTENSIMSFKRRGGECKGRGSWGGVGGRKKPRFPNAKTLSFSKEGNCGGRMGYLSRHFKMLKS